ncbi:hypothetical protein BN1095_5530001 [Clostridioides difficile]|uniref:Uncharacterized protein n=1 Tax=Clostridioides difficile TaxID=1496 RepID=A0A069AWM4_CLODI|nr:hypothetical protein BN1095_5530001 [Clostridioides difficile]
MQQGLGNRHVDLVLTGSIEDFFYRADPFGNVSDFDQHLMQFLAFCQTQADAAVA